MSKGKRAYARKIAEEKKNKAVEKAQFQDVSPGKTVSDSDAYSKTVEIREKRIGIVFKVIYVIAIFFAAIFFNMAKDYSNGITELYILESCAAAFLFVMLTYMIGYIINEMECLKLTAIDLPKVQIDATERSYSRIFWGLKIAGVSAVIDFSIGYYLISNGSELFIKYVLVGVYFGWAIFLLFQISSQVGSHKVLNFIYFVLCCFFGMLALICTFLLPAIGKVAAIIAT